jgi:hypothetical protein
LAISLALAFEIGAAASLASLIVLDKMNKFLVWMLFIVLTCMQAMGNTYYAYTHIHNFQSWSELFGLIEEDIIYQKRLLSIISGAILPLVSLGFIKSLVDYIKPEEEKEVQAEDIILDLKKEAESLNVDTAEVEKDVVQEEIQNEPVQSVNEQDIPSEPIGEVIESVNRHKSGYIPTDLDPTKII